MEASKDSVQASNLKVIMAGDSLVGKTSVLRAFIDDSTIYSSSDNAEESKSVVQADIQYKTVKMKDGAKVRLQMWDAPNVPMNLKNPAVQYTQHLRKAVGAVLVFDLTNRESFSHISRWISLIRRTADPQCQIILLGNKSDLCRQPNSDEHSNESRFSIVSQHVNPLVYDVGANNFHRSSTQQHDEEDKSQTEDSMGSQKTKSKISSSDSKTDSNDNTLSPSETIQNMEDHSVDDIQQIQTQPQNISVDCSHQSKSYSYSQKAESERGRGEEQEDRARPINATNKIIAHGYGQENVDFVGSDIDSLGQSKSQFEQTQVSLGFQEMVSDLNGATPQHAESCQKLGIGVEVHDHYGTHLGLQRGNTGKETHCSRNTNDHETVSHVSQDLYSTTGFAQLSAIPKMQAEINNEERGNIQSSRGHKHPDITGLEDDIFIANDFKQPSSIKPIARKWTQNQKQQLANEGFEEAKGKPGNGQTHHGKGASAESMKITDIMKQQWGLNKVHMQPVAFEEESNRENMHTALRRDNNASTATDLGIGKEESDSTGREESTTASSGSNQRQVSFQQAYELAQMHGLLYAECSATQKKHVQFVLNEHIQYIYKEQKRILLEYHAGSSEARPIQMLTDKKLFQANPKESKCV